MKKLILLLPLFITSCTYYQKVGYKTADIIVSPTTKTIPISVSVQVLEDNRLALTENAILFSKPRQTAIDGKTMCLNSEKHYAKDSVVFQITRILTQHMKTAALFESTSFKDSENCPYYLSGKLNAFYGEQGFSTAAAVGAQFGLIGALATASVKTDGKITIEVSDLKLFKKDGTLVKDLGSFYKEYVDSFRADGYCWCIYANVNEKLKDFNAQLIEKIRNDLSDIKF